MCLNRSWPATAYACTGDDRDVTGAYRTGRGKQFLFDEPHCGDWGLCRSHAVCVVLTSTVAYLARPSAHHVQHLPEQSRAGQLCPCHDSVCGHRNWHRWRKLPGQRQACCSMTGWNKPTKEFSVLSLATQILLGRELLTFIALASSTFFLF